MILPAWLLPKGPNSTADMLDLFIVAKAALCTPPPTYFTKVLIVVQLTHTHYYSLPSAEPRLYSQLCSIAF